MMDHRERQEAIDELERKGRKDVKPRPAKQAPVPANGTAGFGTPADVRARTRLYLWGAAFAFFWVVGAAVRLYGVLTLGYDGDTISTLYYFVRLPPMAIMTSFALPNNHALSTLMMKMSIAVFGVTPLGVRLPALLFGVSIPILVALAASIVFRSRLAALFAMAMAGGDGALIHYASVGRGYSVQIALIMGLILTVIAYETGLRDCPSRAQWCRIGVLTLPFAAFLTIPSALIFLAPLMALHVGYMALASRRRMPVGKVTPRAWARACMQQNRPMLLCYGVVVLTMVVWFGTIWPMISEAQVHGVRIEGANQFVRFAFSTLASLRLWPAMLLSLPLLTQQKYRHWGALAWAFVGLALMTAPVTRAGPVRIYTPLLPVCYVCAGGGAMVVIQYVADTGLFGRRVLAPAGTTGLLAFCLWGMQSRADAWVGTLDFHTSWFAVKDALPPDACIFHPAERGLYLNFYDPGFAAEGRARIPREECPIALVEARADAASVPAVQDLSGIILANGADVLHLTIDDVSPTRTLHFPNCVASVYQLRSIRKVESFDRSVVLAAISLASPDLAVAIVRTLTDDGNQAGLWCTMNPYNQPPSPRGRGVVLAAKAPPVPLATLLRLEDLGGDAVHFFVIAGGPPGGSRGDAP